MNIWLCEMNSGLWRQEEEKHREQRTENAEQRRGDERARANIEPCILLQSPTRSLVAGVCERVFVQKAFLLAPKLLSGPPLTDSTTARLSANLCGMLRLYPYTALGDCSVTSLCSYAVSPEQ